MKIRRLGRNQFGYDFAYNHPGLLFAADDGGGGGDPAKVAADKAAADKVVADKATADAAAVKTGEKTLTQTEVNAIAAREKNEGKAAAETAIAASLGVTIEEAKEIVKAHKASEEAKKTDVDKAKEAADKEKATATSDRSAAAKEIHEARLERAFLREGLDITDEANAAKVKRIIKMVSVEPGTSYDEVLADVKLVKADFPALFEEPIVKGRKAPNGDPKGTPAKPKAGEDAYAKGLARAKGARGAFTARMEPAQKDNA